MTKTTATMFKPGYDGDRPSTRTTAPERQMLRQGKPDLVRRLHDAMLTLSVQGRAGPAGVKSNCPAYLVEFADRVGAEQEAPPRARFRPTAAQVSDMPKALALLDGLTRPHFQVVLLHALDEFSREDGGEGDWPWKKIGERFGFSDRWAEGAYEASIIQAARRAGVIPMNQTDYAVLIAGVWHERAWLTNLSTTADPRMAVANMKAKSAIPPAKASAIWLAGPPVAKRIASDLKRDLTNLHSHGSWLKHHPDTLTDLVVKKAREIGAEWMIEDIVA
jgi:hypothetical protein